MTEIKTKLCPHCKEIKPVNEFNHSKRTKDGYDYRCKQCQNLSNKSWCKRNWFDKIKQQNQRCKDLTDKIRIYKQTHGCYYCNENTPCCLDLHHLDPSVKEINPSCMASNGWGWNRMLKELDKCIVVCANCHRKIHEGILPWPVGKTVNPSHCHCEDNRGSTDTGRHKSLGK